jgi:hypothetical protein
MPEKKRVYESSLVVPMKLKAAPAKAPAPGPEKRNRSAQQPRKTSPEMIAVVLRLIEYFENN